MQNQQTTPASDASVDCAAGCAASFELLHAVVIASFIVVVVVMYFYAKAPRRHELKPKLNSLVRPVCPTPANQRQLKALCFTVNTVAAAALRDDEIVKRKPVQKYYKAHNLEEVKSS